MTGAAVSKPSGPAMKGGCNHRRKIHYHQAHCDHVQKPKYKICSAFTLNVVFFNSSECQGAREKLSVTGRLCHRQLRGR